MPESAATNQAKTPKPQRASSVDPTLNAQTVGYDEPGLANSKSMLQQANLLGNCAIPLVQRQKLAMKIGQVQGNHHMQRVIGQVNPPAAPRSEIAPANTPPRPLHYTPNNTHFARAPLQRMLIPGTNVNVPITLPYGYSHTHAIDKGKYIKVKSVTFNIGGQLEDMAPPGSTNAPVSAEGGGGTSASSGGEQAPSSQQVASYKATVKQTADDFFSQKVASLGNNITPYRQGSAGFTRTQDETSVNLGYEHGFEMSPFLFQNTQLTAGIEFSLLELKKKKGQPIEFSPLAASPKVELSGSYDNFPINGLKFTAKGSVVVTFEPDWVTLGMMALETPTGWVVAAGVAAAVITYYSMKDLDRQQQLMRRVQTNARGIIQAANAYASVVSGQPAQASNRWAADAINQANQDFGAVGAQHDLTKEMYYDMVEMDNKGANFYNQAFALYRDKALSAYQGQVEQDIETWHQEHMWQSFWAKRYAIDDIADARNIIAQETASGGMVTIG